MIGRTGFYIAIDRWLKVYPDLTGMRKEIVIFLGLTSGRTHNYAYYNFDGDKTMKPLTQIDFWAYIADLGMCFWLQQNKEALSISSLQDSQTRPSNRWYRTTLHPCR